MEYCADRDLKKGLELLVTVAFRFHPQWVEKHKDDFLFAALSLGDVSLVRKLLGHGADPAYGRRTRQRGRPSYFQTGLGAAAACGALDCARLLLEHCDPNTMVTSVNLDGWGSVFFDFLFELRAVTRRATWRQATEDPFLQVLHLMLDTGADVDTLMDGEVYIHRLKRREPYSRTDLQEWCPIYLDFIYHQHGEFLFHLLLPHSQQWIVELTRSGICTAALRGRQTLSKYLGSVQPRPGLTSERCCEITLLEQFPTNGYQVQEVGREQSRIARVLIEFGVSIPAELNGKDLLASLTKTASHHPRRHDASWLLDHFVQREDNFDWRDLIIILFRPHERSSSLTVEYLIRQGMDLTQSGQEALLKAASFKTDEAFNMLVAMGVDVTGETEHRGHRRTLLAHFFLETPKVLVLSHKWWLRFIDRGARWRLQAQDLTCYELLVYLVTMETTGDRLQFFLEFEDEFRNITHMQWNHLTDLLIDSSSLDAATITFFFQRSEHYRPTRSVLGTLISKHCPTNIVNALIESGQDINAKSKMTPLQAAAKNLDLEMVSRLLQLGANANSLTEEQLSPLSEACGKKTSSSLLVDKQKRIVQLLVDHGANVDAGRRPTALQMVVNRRTSTPEEVKHLRWLIEFLIGHGADVNAQPPRHGGSLLCSCVEHGDLEMAVLLVQHGADPNRFPYTSPWEIDARLPLDVAAEHGRLDITQYLLNVGALSARPGSTGFQGALDDAKNPAIRELIQQHIKTVAAMHS